MSGLLEIRENIRNFYSKYEVYLLPLFKLLLALTVFLFISASLGYNSKINNPMIVLVVALMCSFLPMNIMVVLGAIFIVLHLYHIPISFFIKRISIIYAIFLINYIMY